MSELYQLQRRLIAEARACGEEIHDAYHLFESYEDWPDNWPKRSEGEDLTYDHFCGPCAESRVDEARRAGLPVVDNSIPWYDRPAGQDDFYDGPFYERDHESDSVRFCGDCGKLLTFSPTSYCLESELDYYRESCDREERASAGDLLLLSELIEGAEGTVHEAEAMAIARDVLSRLHVTAGQELRNRLPTFSKVRAAWKELATIGRDE